MKELSTVDALVQLSFLVQGVLADAVAAHQLSLTQVRLLGVLRGREPGMAELAAHLGLDKSSATGLIDRAERRGLVRRTPSAADRRAVAVSLTAEGKSLATTVETVVTDAIRALTTTLTGQQERNLVAAAGALLAAPAKTADTRRVVTRLEPPPKSGT